MEKVAEVASGASGAKDYPWIEFRDSLTKKMAYRNTKTGEVTFEKPEDFDKFGSATAGSLDRETTALTLVAPPKESRWAKYAEMLNASPLMQAATAVSRTVAESPVGESISAVRDRVRDAQEDAKDAWENSQNPVIVQAASAYDKVFGETEQARAVAKIRELDPDFDAGPDFLKFMKETLIPDAVRGFLSADRLRLSAWCTDECLERVNAVLRAREVEGLVADPTILAVNNVTIMGAHAPEKDAPRMLVSAMVQQVHCLRKKTGEVVEGSETEIRAVVYVFAVQREYRPDKGGLIWQVSELTYTGSMLYL